MNRGFVFALLLSGALFTSAQGEEFLYFGIPGNHRPHAYLNNEEKPSGTLINTIQMLCKNLDKECNFSAGVLFNHLEALQSEQINALLVTDSVLIPAIDEIIFTPPLCNILPIFIYRVKNDRPEFKSIDEIRNATIGVHVDSSFHLYLLDEYYSHSRIKPYSLIESGVFDLVSNRIDALLTEQSFFESRVAVTTLVSKKKKTHLEMIVAEEIKLPFKTMSLALRAKDIELHETLTKAINALGPTKSCVDLVRQSLNQGNPVDSLVPGARK